MITVSPFFTAKTVFLEEIPLEGFFLKLESSQGEPGDIKKPVVPEAHKNPIHPMDLPALQKLPFQIHHGIQKQVIRQALLFIIFPENTRTPQQEQEIQRIAVDSRLLLHLLTAGKRLLKIPTAGPFFHFFHKAGSHFIQPAAPDALLQFFVRIRHFPDGILREGQFFHQLFHIRLLLSACAARRPLEASAIFRHFYKYSS